MVERYAISLFDSDSLSLLKIISEKDTRVETVFILTRENRRIEEELIVFSRELGIRIEVVPIYDFNNFYEVYLMLEKICETNGFPSWINIASGHGMALSALALHAYFKDAPLILFDKERNEIIRTDVNRLKKIKIYSNRYFEIIALISKKNQTNLELAGHFKISVSSMSRRLKHLELLNIVIRKGMGTVNVPYVYQLTEFGKKLL
ncbi:MAG: hypothetical protein M1375_02460 [Candidatus Thermoplasmatota archaeon]|nr:hypothetical protein [Candidatus Thermoplasmatota archaeon]MCL5790818.1 hypothetical protein [Candidatus Thermoplasmatota archaeon]